MAKRVLVVDDHPPTVRLIRAALENEGLEVAAAANGAECLLAISSQPPDLLVLDVIMPVMDGFQTLRVLKENPDTRALPVIILSIRGAKEDIARGLVGGADFYLTKPFQMPELVAAVKRILAISEDPDSQVQPETPPPGP
jgi:CheY-like chemotaxis protein